MSPDICNYYNSLAGDARFMRDRGSEREYKNPERYSHQSGFCLLLCCLAYRSDTRVLPAAI